MRFITLTCVLHTLILPLHVTHGNWRRRISQFYYSCTNLQNHLETRIIDWMGKSTFSTLSTRMDSFSFCQQLFLEQGNSFNIPKDPNTENYKNNDKITLFQTQRGCYIYKVGGFFFFNTVELEYYIYGQDVKD